MGHRHHIAATSRTATRALDAALCLRPVDGNEPSMLAKREQLLVQLEPPL